jgi:hypothetical protein
MKKNSAIAVIMILLVIVIGMMVYNGSAKKEQSGSNNNSAAPISQNNTGPQLFSSSPMSQYAYLISSPTYDANTEQALSGFKVTKSTLADGSIQVTLNAQNPEYKTQTYTVKAGEKLYFIEKTLRDDNGTEDKFLGDDTAVLVDASGYIVTQ